MTSWIHTVTHLYLYMYIQWRRQWQPTLVCLPKNSMDRGAWWASVHGVSKSRTWLSDITFTFHFSLSCVGLGNGSPLQCSCLENARDGGDWWAAVYGVAQGQTRLKWLSSSSSIYIHIHINQYMCIWCFRIFDIFMPGLNFQYFLRGSPHLFCIPFHMCVSTHTIQHFQTTCED